ncbi:hypothetical protein [Vibrio phage vB_VpaP_SJSY21]|nr:hypothetical protein [Vibrio phage vB_VpaP_SJSY21]
MKVEINCEGSDYKTFGDLKLNEHFVIGGRVCFKSEDWEATDIANAEKFDVEDSAIITEIDTLKISYIPV